MHRLKDRGRARKAARRSAGRLVRVAPWLFLLAQVLAIGVVAYLAYHDPAVRSLHAQIAMWHLIVALSACSLWMIYEEGPIAMFYPTMTYMVMFGDDANPWVESLLFGAGASVVSYIGVYVALASAVG